MRAVPIYDVHGLPRERATCTDDDPSCDVGDTADDACTFEVALCLNVSDPRLGTRRTATCRPKGIDRAVVFAPPPRFRRALDAENRHALEQALTGFGAVSGGFCRGEGTLRRCGTDADCPLSPGGLRLRCQQNALIFSPTFETRDACSSLMHVVVPLGHSGANLVAGRRVVKVEATVPRELQVTTRIVSDVDRLRLICRPH